VDSAVAGQAVRTHTYPMTLSTQLKASVVVVMVSALAIASIVGQAFTHFLVKALTDSKSVRVTPISACSTSQDGTHFTGCSSIL